MPSVSPPSATRRSNTISEIHRAMADAQRRLVLYYLRASGGVATFDELVEYLDARSEFPSGSPPPPVLRHTLLPALAECGAIAYDPDDDHVVYRGGSYLTEVLELAGEREAR